MSLIDEQTLLVNSRNGDQTSLGLIYDKYNQGIYRYARRLLGEESLAEDCVSETFSKFLNALQQGNGPKDNLQAYLYRIAHNWITDLYRKKHFDFELFDDTIPIPEKMQPESKLIDHLERKRIQKALMELPENQRFVVILRFIEDWNNEEVSKALQKPVGTIKALQHRALTKLRKSLS